MAKYSIQILFAGLTNTAQFIKNRKNLRSIVQNPGESSFSAIWKFQTFVTMTFFCTGSRQLHSSTCIVVLAFTFADYS